VYFTYTYQWNMQLIW